MRGESILRATFNAQAKAVESDNQVKLDNFKEVIALLERSGAVEYPTSVQERGMQSVDDRMANLRMNWAYNDTFYEMMKREGCTSTPLIRSLSLTYGIAMLREGESGETLPGSHKEVLQLAAGNNLVFCTYVRMYD